MELHWKVWDGSWLPIYSLVNKLTVYKPADTISPSIQSSMSDNPQMHRNLARSISACLYTHSQILNR